MGPHPHPALKCQRPQSPHVYVHGNNTYGEMFLFYFILFCPLAFDKHSLRTGLRRAHSPKKKLELKKKKKTRFYLLSLYSICNKMYKLYQIMIWRNLFKRNHFEGGTAFSAGQIRIMPNTKIMSVVP